jgi:DNA repair exonuclease SbcCD ATPase subunit
VSEHGSTQNSWSIAEVVNPDQRTAADVLTVVPQLPPPEQEALLAELMQVRSLAHEQVERIHHLEQALDQSQALLKDLHRQVVNQQFLETQLASTEEIANIQQQAINRLKLQLAQQQEALETQQAEARQREQAFQDILTALESSTQGQQTELERLRNQLAQERMGVQTQHSNLEKQLADLQTASNAQQQQLLDLEAQKLVFCQQVTGLELQLQQAQTQGQALTQQLGDRQISLEQLETELRQAHTALQEQHDLIERLHRAQVLYRPPSDTLHPDPKLNQVRIEELETQIARQQTTQAMLQHACQELETERDRQQSRLTELEQQTVEMQEQILRQVQQEREYETAIQHWKDRYLNSRELMMQVKDLLETVLPHPPAELVELLAKFPAGTTEIPEPGSPVLPASSPANHATRVDLPDFLIRRRSYKNRRS